MNSIDLTARPVLRSIYKISLRTLILLGATILISVIYKGLIELGLITLIEDPDTCCFVFCIFELLLLLVYWFCTHIFSAICYYRTHSLKTYYIRTGAVFGAFSAIYLLSYLIMSREVFLWVFRVTVNLIGIRLITTAPDNLLPYMLVYLAVMFLIMFSEPAIVRLTVGTWDLYKKEEEE